MDMYRYHPGGKPAAMIPPNRPPPQRYMQPVSVFVIISLLQVVCLV